MRLFLVAWTLVITFSSFVVHAQENVSAFRIAEPGKSVEKSLKAVPLFGSILKGNSVVGKILIVREGEGIEVELDGLIKKIPGISNKLRFDWKTSSISVDLNNLNLTSKPKNSNQGTVKNLKLEKLFDTKQFNRKIADLEAQQNRLSKELVQSKANASDSENKRVKLEGTLNNIQSQLSELQKLYEQAKSELNEKTAKLEDNEGKLAKASENNSKRVSELETLSSSLTQTTNYQKDEIENLKSKLASFENTKAHNDSQLDEYKAQIAKLEKEVSLKVARVQELEAELSTEETPPSEINQDGLENLKHNLETANQEAEVMRNKIAKLENKIAELITENKNVVNETSAAEVQSLTEKIKSLENELNKTTDLQPKVIELEKEIETKDSLIKGLREENQKLTSVNFATTSQKKSNKIDIKINENSSCKNEKNELLRTLCEDLEND